MKSLLCILLFSLIVNLCGENLSRESGKEKKDQAAILSKIDDQINKKHAITENKCHLLHEWLNRKSFVHFLKSHIALESGASVIDKKTQFNDTFIP